MDNKIDWHTLLSPATGEHGQNKTLKKKVSFDRYEIFVELTEDGKFIGISSIKIKKSFIDSFSESHSSDVFDVEEYYNEE